MSAGVRAQLNTMLHIVQAMQGCALVRTATNSTNATVTVDSVSLASETQWCSVHAVARVGQSYTNTFKCATSVLVRVVAVESAGAGVEVPLGVAWPDWWRHYSLRCWQMPVYKHRTSSAQAAMQ
eukprot:2915-Heterococcus_DN1.PRE.3